MNSVSHSWDHAWGDAPYASSDSESDDDFYENISPEVAGEEFAAFLLSLHLSGKLSARSVCILAFWATRAHCIGPAGEFSLKPDSPSGHFQRKIDKYTQHGEMLENVHYTNDHF